MVTRITWLIGGSAIVLSIAAAASVPIQSPQEPPPRQDSFSGGGGPVTESVLASWQAHGANDGPIAPMPSVPLLIPAKPSTGGRNKEAPPGVERAPGLEQDWMLDLLVLWRWRGRAPEITHSAGGDAGPAGPFVHQIVVTGGRELRVVFNRRAGSVAVQDGAPLPLDGANVLMLDVDEQTVRVEGMATVEPRYARLTDPVQAAIARSADVAAFVGVR